MRRALPVLLLLAAACAAPRKQDRDQVRAGEVRLPENAQAGMFVTWLIEQDEPEPDDVVEETVACVARDERAVTMEWRTTLRDGSRRVVAARFRPDGTHLGAWRGTPGEIGRPVEVVPDEDPAVLREGAGRLGRPRRISPDDLKVEDAHGKEVIETPAGRISCLRWTMSSSYQVTSMEVGLWVAEKPLTLSSLVRYQMAMSPGDYRYVQTLSAYGTSGAGPTLEVPTQE
ncbi:MAG: hypothetical protein ACYSUN_14320 [Planctomycetota bacterium]|jgi:hypothetical protein